MKNYLFIGGPWDGLWEEASGEHHITFVKPTKFEFKMTSEEAVFDPIETYTYTLRYIYVGSTSIEAYVLDTISDRHLLTKLLSVYTST